LKLDIPSKINSWNLFCHWPEDPGLSSQDFDLNWDCHKQESIRAFLAKQPPEEVFTIYKNMSSDFERVTCQNLLIT